MEYPEIFRIPFALKIMSALLNNNKSILKDEMGDAEHSHWRQR